MVLRKWESRSPPPKRAEQKNCPALIISPPHPFRSRGLPPPTYRQSLTEVWIHENGSLTPDADSWVSIIFKAQQNFSAQRNYQREGVVLEGGGFFRRKSAFSASQRNFFGLVAVRQHRYHNRVSTTCILWV